MAALPPFAPWIKAPDETGNFGAGFQLAASAAAAAANREATKQQLMLDQQKSEIDRAYKESLMGIQRQQLLDEQKKLEISTKRAAEQSAARLRIQQRIAAGEDFRKVYMEEGPSAFSTAAGFGTIFKPQAPAPTTSWVAPTGGAPGYVVDPRGTPHFPPATAPKPPPLTQEQKDAIAERTANAEIIKADIKKLDASIDIAEAASSPDEKLLENLHAKRLKRMTELRDLFRKKGEESSGRERAVIVNGKLVYQKPEITNLPDMIQSLGELPETPQWQGAPATLPPGLQLPPEIGDAAASFR